MGTFAPSGGSVSRIDQLAARAARLARALSWSTLYLADGASFRGCIEVENQRVAGASARGDSHDYVVTCVLWVQQCDWTSAIACPAVVRDCAQRYRIESELTALDGCRRFRVVPC